MFYLHILLNLFIKHFGEYDENRVTIIEDICAAAKGYEILAYNALRREQEQTKKPAKPKAAVPDDTSENKPQEVTDNADDQSDKPSTES